ncbi:hypothetical protein [Campylobacter concisus]|uniref:hypothetical protein n=1 Tax=Campylobacter concisus TaxID=199 RepID=UPI00131E68EF|nr:hypothetical protein [Campylobacter concisus]
MKEVNKAFKKGSICKKLDKSLFKLPYKFDLISASNVQNKVNKNAATGELAATR